MDFHEIDLLKNQTNKTKKKNSSAIVPPKHFGKKKRPEMFLEINDFQVESNTFAKVVKALRLTETFSPLKPGPRLKGKPGSSSKCHHLSGLLAFDPFLVELHYLEKDTFDT